MKSRTKKHPRRPAGSMIIEAATSDLPISAFIALFKSSDGKSLPVEDARALKSLQENAGSLKGG